MKAVIDRDTCIGCGLCESLCPNVFKLDDGNIATVIVKVIPQQSEACAEQAKEKCPISSITVE